MLKRIFALAAVLMIPSMAFADNLAGDAGPFELSVSGSGTNDRQFSEGGFTVNGNIGYFVLPFLEVSARDGVSYEDFGTGHSWDNTVRGAIDFNLPLDRFEPYIGGNIGYLAGDNTRSTPEAAPELGLKFFCSNSAFVFVQAEYDFFWNRNNTTFDTGEFNYVLGVGFRF